MTMLERVIAAGRPFQVKGKGFLFDPFTPRNGSREAIVVGNYRMNLDLSNAIHRQIFMGCFARDMTRWARALLHPGGTFLDVGAHAGYFSLLAADRVGSSGRVCAVEPNPQTFAALKTHLTINAVTNVVPLMCGLADRAGSMSLHAPSSGRDYNATMLPRTDWVRFDVAVRTLDECIREWNVTCVDLMKIDVEGAEPLVIAGGAGCLGRGVVRHAMIEINGPRLAEAGGGPAALGQTLAHLGFNPASMVSGRIVARPWSTFDADPTHETDCLFVHRSARS
jgi:FkbM family methyltransferase